MKPIASDERASAGSEAAVFQENVPCVRGGAQRQTSGPERCALPIRIYTLAKQLKLENKALVDICAQIGITGKGSALASLTDEELVSVAEDLFLELDQRESSNGHA